MRSYRLATVAVLLLACCGCQGTYFNAWEKLGYHKRDILVSRVQKARDGQEAAKEQFQSTLDKFKAVTGFKGGDLEAKYKALSTDYDGISKLFGSENGVAARLSTTLTARLADTAELSQRTKALNAKSVTLQKDAAALETRMAVVAARYNQQFNALDSLLSNMQQTSSFLTTQLSQIANISKS